MKTLIPWYISTFSITFSTTIFAVKDWPVVPIPATLTFLILWRTKTLIDQIKDDLTHT